MTNRLISIAIAIAIGVVVFQGSIDQISEANGFQHLFASIALVLVFSFMTSSLAQGMFIALFVGFIKELIDPTFSHIDISMDLIGVLVGAMIVEALRVSLRRL